MSEETPETPETEEPYIEVIFPNGGEEWELGKSYEINWQFSGIENVNIYLNFGDSGICKLAKVPASQQKYVVEIKQGAKCLDIPINNIPGAEYTVTVEDAKEIQIPLQYDEKAPISDISDNCFSIVEKSTNNRAPETEEPYIEVIFPNGGEEWEYGKTYTIKWDSKGINNINIGLQDWTGIVAGDDYKFCVVAKNIPASSGEYSWTVENCPLDGGDHFMVRITDSRSLEQGNLQQAEDTNDNYFSIIKE